MNPQRATLATSDKPKPKYSYLRIGALLLTYLLAWTLFAAIAALTSLNDDLRIGLYPEYLEVFKEWAKSAALSAFFCLILYALLSKWQILFASLKNIVLSYAVLILCLLPLQLILVAQNWVLGESDSMNWHFIQQQINELDRYGSLLHLGSVSAFYVAVVGFKIWQNGQEHQQQLQAKRNDILLLRLELEQQKMQALKAQLEPHFVFNALNAISALVITEDKDKTLNGLQSLSELLRYALTASENDFVKLREEIAFIEDYLELQKMRYGERLQVEILGMNAELAEADCPPLLLQALVENAIRHDLDRHRNSSTIKIVMQAKEEEIELRISNALHPQLPTNPGAGRGLKNTKERLDLIYHGQAQLRLMQLDEQFIVELDLPYHRPQLVETN